MSAEIYRYIIELKNASALKVAESDLISLESLFNTISYECVTYYYLIHSETSGDRVEPVKINDNPKSGLQFFFGHSLFTHGGATLFESHNNVNGPKKMCQEITKGYFCSGPDVALVLSKFICSDHNRLIHHSYENFKNNFKISLKEAFGSQFESKSSSCCDSIFKSISSFVDDCISKVEGRGQCIEKSVIVLKKAKELCENDKHDIASLCKIVTALCYCSLYFLALTDSKSNNELRNITDKHAMSKVIRELPNLLNSIKAFLDYSEALSQEADESYAMQSDERRIRQEPKINDIDIVDSPEFGELLLKLTLLSQANYGPKEKRAGRAQIISDFVNTYFESEQVSDAKMVERLAQTLGIDKSDKYIPIRMMLKKCSVALRLINEAELDEEAQDYYYIYNVYLSRAEMLRQTVANDYEPKK